MTSHENLRASKTLRFWTGYAVEWAQIGWTRMIDNRYPAFRSNIDIQRVMHDGHPHLLLRDPLQLAEQSLLIPLPLASVLGLCDGTQADARALSAATAIRYGVSLKPGDIQDLLAALDQAFLLENRAYAQARERALTAYRQLPFRPPASAGSSYPAEPGELRRLLDTYLEEAGPLPPLPQGSGLVSPHIDYERGGLVYAQVWRQAAEIIRQADLALILGTNHFGDDGLLTLTRQNYATPYGTLPTAGAVVAKLAEVLGETAFEGELYHAREHSVELAAVWLHHMLDGKPCELVPVLCGSLERHLAGGVSAEADPVIHRFVSAFREATAGRRVVIIAAGDLAHVGPAFGGQPLDAAQCASLGAADDALIRQMCQGDAAGFWAAIRKVDNRNNVCGVSPIYLTLRLLAPAQGVRTGYAQCQADEAGTSAVSICGIVFAPPEA